MFCVFSHFVRSVLAKNFGQPFRFRIALNAIFSSSLLNKQLWRPRLESQLMDAMYGMLPKEPHFQSIQSNRCSTFIQKFIVLQRGYHHARRLNKVNKIKSNDVKKEKKNSIKDKMD